MLMFCGFLVECTGLGFVNEIEEGRRFFFLLFSCDSLVGGW